MLKHPVKVILIFFGLLDAGVEFSGNGTAIWLDFLGLIAGKPFGVLLFGCFAVNPMKLGLPSGVPGVDRFLIG